MQNYIILQNDITVYSGYLKKLNKANVYNFIKKLYITNFFFKNVNCINKSITYRECGVCERYVV